MSAIEPELQGPRLARGIAQREMPQPSATDTFSTILARHAAIAPEDLAYIYLHDGESDEQRITYGDLHQRASVFASALSEAVPVGGRALILMPPGPDYIAAVFGCFHAGVVGVSATPPHPKRLHRTLPRLLTIAADAAAECVLTIPAIKSAAEPLLAEGQPLADAVWVTADGTADARAQEWGIAPRRRTEVAFLQYTSGSTADPRGVVLTHENLVVMCQIIAGLFGLQAGRDLGFSWLPPYHDMGLIGGLLQPVYSGGACVLSSPLTVMKRPMRWLEGISRYGATTSGAPDFAFDLCTRLFDPAKAESLDLSSWAVAFNGAEPIRAATLDAFAETFEPYGFRRSAFLPCYGLAEATLLVTGVQRDAQPVLWPLASSELEQGRIRQAVAAEPSTTLVGCGAPYAGHEIAIVDPDTCRRCEYGQVGEIWVAGPAVAAGYWRRPGETIATFAATLAGDQEDALCYLRTGDLGTLIDGELLVVGRLKDLIILNGRNLHPHDLEASAEAAHAAVRPHCSAAFAITSEADGGVALVLEVEALDEGSPTTAGATLIEAVRRRLAGELDVQLDRVALCTQGSVPKTTSGKVQRRLCGEMLDQNELDVIAEWHRARAG
jgi:acyl-CoA synthetase (AMP-forming)/AMP-acid ligase II